MPVINTRSFGRFWHVSWASNHSYMGYLSPFWVLGVISTIDETQGAFTCRSSTLAVLADSGLFLGLVITVTRAINHRLGVLGVISTIDEAQGAFTCWSSTLAVFADSGMFHWLLITVRWAINHHFGSPE